MMMLVGQICMEPPMSRLISQTANPDDLSPFHSGEHRMQSRVGKRQEMEQIGKRVIRSFMPDQHRAFFQQLPFMLVGSVDEQGWPWASILTGQPGFVHSPAADSLELNAQPFEGDPLVQVFSTEGTTLGLLGIELPTRRRNRVNGSIASVEYEKPLPRQRKEELRPHSGAVKKVTFKVDQSFGNCPKYIQTRGLSFLSEQERRQSVGETESFTHLSGTMTELIRQADTFFVASVAMEEQDLLTKGLGVDVSHRGGAAGFIRVEDNRLTIPDYAGNQFFNTLGNFLVNPKAGLLFTDFETGDVLMLTGEVTLLGEDHPDVIHFKGAERGWQFELIKGVKLPGVLPFRATLKERSPQLESTGSWSFLKEQSSHQHPQDKNVILNPWRPFTVTRVVEESSQIRSFYLTPADQESLAPFKPGQHLSIRGRFPSGEQGIRNYSLSSSSTGDEYRISVKKEAKGRFSQFMHQQVTEGSVLEVKAPAGRFYLDTGAKRPVVMVAGGVGVTPMCSSSDLI